MKKILALILAMGICIGGSACTVTDLSESSETSSSNSTPSQEFSESSEEQSSEKSEETEDTTPLSESEIKQMYTDPDKFMNRTVTLTGRVFTSPERDEDGIYFQMFYDTENHDLNTIVAYLDPDFELEEGDYVKLTGVVSGNFEGENAFGGTVTAPQIIATSLEKSSYTEVVSPALKTVTPKGTSSTQHGYTVSLTKVEFAKNETRLYFTVENGGKATFNLYSFDTKLIQNGKQYEEETNYDADYPEIQSDLLPGVTTEGIIVFPAIDQKNFQVVLDAFSDDFDEDFELYTFDVSVE